MTLTEVWVWTSHLQAYTYWYTTTTSIDDYVASHEHVEIEIFLRSVTPLGP